jgi:glycosyltransferase involved in cell wall biosynthesis
MKILHVVGMANAGAGEHVLSLARHCDPDRFESSVAMADSSPMRAEFERAGVRVLPLSLDHHGGLKRNVVAFRQLTRLLRRERFDLIQTHTSVAGALGRVAAKMCTRAPVVHMLHAFAAHPHRSPASRGLALFVERRLDRFTDWYIAGSRAMVERGVAQRIFRANKVVLISNGIDLSRFDGGGSGLPPEQKPESRPITIGFLGRLEKQKGVAYLIRAAALVREQNRNVRFLIAGDGQLRSQLERLTAELQVSDMVEFVGWQRDVPAFLERIDIMAMPSLWEAFGLSAAEAMAMRKPVIASRIEGLPEVVDHDRTGILVPPAEPEALARAIVELAGDPQRQRTLGQQGRARVEQHFTVTRMIERHEALYERLAGHPVVERPPSNRFNAQEQRGPAISIAD